MQRMLRKRRGPSEADDDFGEPPLPPPGNVLVLAAMAALIVLLLSLARDWRVDFAAGAVAMGSPEVVTIPEFSAGHGGRARNFPLRGRTMARHSLALPAAKAG